MATDSDRSMSEDERAVNVIVRRTVSAGPSGINRVYVPEALPRVMSGRRISGGERQCPATPVPPSVWAPRCALHKQRPEMSGPQGTRAAADVTPPGASFIRRVPVKLMNAVSPLAMHSSPCTWSSRHCTYDFHDFVKARTPSQSVSSFNNQPDPRAPSTCHTVKFSTWPPPTDASEIPV